MHIQVHVGNGDEPLATCTHPEEMDEVLNETPFIRADILIALEFPLEATVVRIPGGLERVHLKVRESVREFDRLSGRDVDPGKLGVSCSSRGDIVPVRTINLGFRDHADDLTDRGVVWVRGGDEAIAHLTLYPRRIAVAGMKPSQILNEAIEEIIERLLMPFMKI